MAHGTPKHHPKSRPIHMTPVKSAAGKKERERLGAMYEGPGPKYGQIPRVIKMGPYPKAGSSRQRPQRMDIPDSGREIIDRPVTTMAEHLKPPRGAGTKKAVTAGGKAAGKVATAGAKAAVSQVRKTAQGRASMMKKAGSWIKRQGFIPTIR